MNKRVSALIEYILHDMELGYDHKVGYFHCSNPISAKNGKKDRSYSAQWNNKYGGLTVWNGDTINGKTHISFNEVVSYLGYQDKYEEIMGTKHFHINSFYSENKLKRKKVVDKNPPKEVDIDPKHYKLCEEYLQSRGLEVIAGLIEPANVEFVGKFGTFHKPYIAMRYSGGFNKYRYIHSKNKKDRFISFGGNGYESFFEMRRDGSDKVFLIEGESEAYSISKYVEDDILSMHNLNTVPSNITYEYKEVVILIDSGKFNEVSWGLYKKVKPCFPNARVSIRPKLIIWYDGKYDYEGYKEYDFNDLHKEGKLTSDIVETGLLSKDDIDCWKYREEYKKAGYDPENMIKKFEFLRK